MLPMHLMPRFLQGDGCRHASGCRQASHNHRHDVASWVSLRSAVTVPIACSYCTGPLLYCYPFQPWGMRSASSFQAVACSNSHPFHVAQLCLLLCVLGSPSSCHHYSPDVRAVYAAIMAASRPGALFLDASTIDVETAVAMAGQAAQHDMEFLDCPVSGGKQGAAARTEHMHACLHDCTR